MVMIPLTLKKQAVLGSCGISPRRSETSRFIAPGGQRLTFDDKITLARTILDHCRICGVTLSRKPPLEGHDRRPSSSGDGK
jgi:hypothetical protein